MPLLQLKIHFLVVFLIRTEKLFGVLPEDLVSRHNLWFSWNPNARNGGDEPVLVESRHDGLQELQQNHQFWIECLYKIYECVLLNLAPRHKEHHEK